MGKTTYLNWLAGFLNHQQYVSFREGTDDFCEDAANLPGIRGHVGGYLPTSEWSPACHVHERRERNPWGFQGGSGAPQNKAESDVQMKMTHLFLKICTFTLNKSPSIQEAMDISFRTWKRVVSLVVILKFMGASVKDFLSNIRTCNHLNVDVVYFFHGPPLTGTFLVLGNRLYLTTTNSSLTLRKESSSKSQFFKGELLFYR